MTVTHSARPDTCPAWCVLEHGIYAGEDDHLHTGAPLRLARGVTAHLCATIDPKSGRLNGPYVVVGGEEWTLQRTRSIGHALIALAEQAMPGDG